MAYVKINITKEMEEAQRYYCGEDADCSECPCCIGDDDCVYNYDVIEDEK